MAIQLKSARVERWPVAGEFVISRGAKDHVDVVVAEVEAGGATGRGEGTPVYYLDEDAAGCRDQILHASQHIADLGAAEARAAIQEIMGPGAARNAVQFPLWSSLERVAMDAGVEGQQTAVIGEEVAGRGLGDPGTEPWKVDHQSRRRPDTRVRVRASDPATDRGLMGHRSHSAVSVRRAAS